MLIKLNFMIIKYGIKSGKSILPKYLYMPPHLEKNY